jgi:hypothetical protein
MFFIEVSKVAIKNLSYFPLFICFYYGDSGVFGCGNIILVNYNRQVVMKVTKRFITIVIDSLNPRTFINCLHQNKIPALKFLVDNGRMTLECVSAFPTMTPVAAASIATGVLPDRHGLPGFIWYDHNQGRKINYGATKQAVVELGVYRVIQDFLFDLNKIHLEPTVPTIFEILEHQGISAGSINFFCFRGLTEHQVKVPLSIQLTSGFRLKGSVVGPSQLVLGKLVNKNISLLDLLKWEKKFGFNDDFTFRAAWKMLKDKQAPSFLMVYFPDNDSYSHRYGPLNTEASIIKVDRYIGELLSIYGSWHKAIRENVFLILGDHSQSSVNTGGLALINLEVLLGELKEEIVICPNERMAYLHCLSGKRRGRELAGLLARDSRIGIIAWREGSEVSVLVGGGDDQLIFSPGTQVVDTWGTCWDYRGDLGIMDGRIEIKEKLTKITFGDYPAAFTRLASALNCLPEDTVTVSARPGHEFFCKNAPVHVGGGSHGSLHQNDSLVPLVISGSDLWPAVPTIFSLMELWCRHFGLIPPTQGN